MDSNMIWMFGAFAAGVVVGWLARCNWIGEGSAAPVEPSSQATEHPHEPNIEDMNKNIEKQREISSMVEDVSKNGGEYSFVMAKGKIQDVHHVKPQGSLTNRTSKNRGYR